MAVLLEVRITNEEVRATFDHIKRSGMPNSSGSWIVDFKSRDKIHTYEPINSTRAHNSGPFEDLFPKKAFVCFLESCRSVHSEFQE